MPSTQTSVLVGARDNPLPWGWLVRGDRFNREHAVVYIAGEGANDFYYNQHIQVIYRITRCLVWWLMLIEVLDV